MDTDRGVRVGRGAAGALIGAAVVLAAGPAGAGGVQVASVAPTEVVLEWTTEAEEPARWWVRRSDGAPDTSDAGDAGWEAFASDAAPSRYHVAEAEELQPGTAYELRVAEDGPTTRVTTPEPPPGELRARLFVLTDIHLCVDDCPNGVRRLGASRAAYAAAMKDIVGHAGALPAGLPRAIVILGDLAQRPTAATWAAVAEPDRGGIPMCVIPGNHDGWDEQWKERWRELLEKLESPECRMEDGRGVLDLGPWRVALLNSAVPGDNWGALGDEQHGWLEGTLAEAPERPTLLAMHHPYASHPAAVALGRDARYTYLQDAAALEDLLERSPQVAAVLSGHVHLNWTGKRGTATQYVFSALVQYPMGWHALALYDGGIVRTYHPLRETAAESAASREAVREWGRSTGIPFADGVTALVYGSLSDRSGVVVTAGAPASADAGAGGDADARSDATAGVPVPSGAGHGAGAQDAAAGGATESGRDVTSDGTDRGTGAPRRSGCRCAAAGADPPGLWFGVVLGSALLLRRRRGAFALRSRSTARPRTGAGGAGRRPARGACGSSRPGECPR
ncbi:MAG: metallophosphoesterase family protein [Deltaproteobacteria bacterium]|nr:metallophosphoesterase family protein [Deltaproteobacteria bacterium]